MKAIFNNLGEKFDVLSQRERVLIAVVVLVLLGMLGFMPVESLWKNHSRIA